MPAASAASASADAGVQYWAVGRDCCGASGFHCDSVGVSSAHYGMVVYNRTDIFTPLIGSDVRFYMQAMEMSGARFGLKLALQPLFVRWVENTMLARAVYVGRAWVTWLKASLVTLPLWLLLSLGAPSAGAAPGAGARGAVSG